MIRLLILLLLLNFYSCIEKDIKESNFVGYLVANDSIKIPFDFVFKDSLITISNSKENIKLIRSVDQHDSIKFVSPYFEDYLLFHDHFDSLSGYLHNKSLDRKVKFFALRGENKVVNHENFLLIEGKWKIIFNYDKSESHESEMIISQNKNKIQGTFRTETGDYGFMQGFVDKNKFNLTNFNGYRANLVKAKVYTDTIFGVLYQGNHNVKKFIGFRDDSFNLPDPYALTSMTPGYEKFLFSFRDIEGKIVDNFDKKFLNKVNIIQIMGTWCPNCLDESIYLKSIKEKYKDVVIVSIAFEFAKSKEQAIENLIKLKKNIGIDYDILLAQYGSSDKIDAANKLKSIDTLISYPTLFITDKNLKVRRIHTGFNGPATGEKYTQFKRDFENFLTQLINE